MGAERFYQGWSCCGTPLKALSTLSDAEKDAEAFEGSCGTWQVVVVVMMLELD